MAKYPGTLESSNPKEFGIVKAEQVGGFKQVDTKEDLDKIPLAILSPKKDGSDAEGQMWYVKDEKCYYKLKSWHTSEEHTWEKYSILNNLPIHDLRNKVLKGNKLFGKSIVSSPTIEVYNALKIPIQTDFLTPPFINIVTLPNKQCRIETNVIMFDTCVHVDPPSYNYEDLNADLELIADNFTYDGGYYNSLSFTTTVRTTNVKGSAPTPSENGIIALYSNQPTNGESKATVSAYWRSERNKSLKGEFYICDIQLGLDCVWCSNPNVKNISVNGKPVEVIHDKTSYAKWDFAKGGKSLENLKEHYSQHLLHVSTVYGSIIDSRVASNPEYANILPFVKHVTRNSFNAVFNEGHDVYICTEPESQNDFVKISNDRTSDHGFSPLLTSTGYLYGTEMVDVDSLKDIHADRIVGLSGGRSLSEAIKGNGAVQAQLMVALNKLDREVKKLQDVDTEAFQFEDIEEVD